LKVKPVGK